MARRQLIIDCDPGIDDAVALLLAFAAREELELLGITTVAGNVAVELTARNARLMRQLAGREEVPVHAGCARPMVRASVTADHYHGVTGLGHLAVQEPAAPLAKGHAVDFLITTLMRAAPHSVTLAVTGPMTNVAMALVLEPRIRAGLLEIVVMGGARAEGGNITASAEYNIHADPHAAHVVFGSGCEVTVFGLDATHQVRATASRIAVFERLGASGYRAAAAVAQLLRFSLGLEPALQRNRGAPLHDPCTIAWLLRPDLFVAQPCYLDVEIASPLTLGHTAVEFRQDARRPMTMRWITKADDGGVFDLLQQQLARR